MPAPDPAGAAAVTENPLGGCQQCHVDVEDELIGTAHFDEGIGCIKCHGPSQGHAADENNEVAPDHVYARKDIDAFCADCHECTRPADTEPATPEVAKEVCIDCHGPHDLQLAGAE